MTDTPFNMSKMAAEYIKLITYALPNERKDYLRSNSERLDKDVNFNEFEICMDEVFADDNAVDAFDAVVSSFIAANYLVTISNAMLYDALSKIDSTMRDVALMAYGLNMTDREVANELELERRTVNRIGKRALKVLKKILEGEGFNARNFKG